MSLEEKVRAVEAVMERLDGEIGQFQNWSGLSCQWGCGKCCFKPDIEASVLEFLPFAYYLHQSNQTDAWLAKIDSNAGGLCPILNPLQGGAGMCSQYQYRGLICRLFGYSARTNKYGRKELVTCQLIKSEQKSEYAAAEEKLSAGAPIPVMGHFYMQLHAIDFEMAQEFFPINEAIKRAIEAILHYYAYRS